MCMNTKDTYQVGPTSPLYGVVLADPPWRYKYSQSDNRKIENHYPTMSTEEICSLGIPSAENAVLFLWSTSPHLPDALRVMGAWGFEYKSSLVWDKVSMGCGYWARIQHELILIGTKGHFRAPSPSLRVRSVLRIPRTIHSRKPAEVRDMIARWYPHETKLEMFARERTPNWATWGNEVVCDVELGGNGFAGTVAGETERSSL
jgi:N6-adenosine-specific RNA methylase IME4